MEYRVAEPRDWEQLADLHRRVFHVEPPSQAASTPIIAVNESGEIVGFLWMTLTCHVEPLYVNPEYTGKVQLRCLRDLAENVLTHGHYFAFSPNGKIAGILSAMGFEQLPWTVWRKEIRKEG